jgi:hypothetical protein
MNYFFIVNLVFLLVSLGCLITFSTKGPKDTRMIAPASPKAGDARPVPKNRFYIDYFYTCGIIYAASCGLLFFWNCLDIVLKGKILNTPNIIAVGKLLNSQQEYYFFLAATGFTIAFFILPERTRKLSDAQPTYVVLSLVWLLIALISSSDPK